jgi:hypothetical protein
MAMAGVRELDCPDRRKGQVASKWETEWGVGTTATFNNTHQANFIARRLLQEAGLGIEHSFVYEFLDNGTEHYGVDSSGA